MTILNLMLGKGRGGLEQAVLDYAEALATAQIPALTIISRNAWIEAPLVAAAIRHESMTNRGQWDIFAAKRLRAIALKNNATAIICHGNRAIALALKAFAKLPINTRPAVIAVAHNYSNRRFAKADACFAITHHLADHLTALGATRIAHMPNMVRNHNTSVRTVFRNPPVIGSMGRFVAKKGFNTYVEALAILRDRGVAFCALLGGDGEESDAINTLIARYQLGKQLTRIGWVKDKAGFFDLIDVFVLPSLHEAFGIVLIEAMSYRLPVISADAEGPREILHHGVDGLLVPRNDPEKLADALAELLANPAQAATLGNAAQQHVNEQYSMQAMAQRLQTALAPYMNKA